MNRNGLFDKRRLKKNSYMQQGYWIWKRQNLRKRRSEKDDFVPMQDAEWHEDKWPQMIDAHAITHLSFGVQKVSVKRTAFWRTGFRRPKRLWSSYPRPLRTWKDRKTLTKNWNNFWTLPLRSFFLFICLSICLFIYLSIYLPVCPCITKSW